MSAKDELPQDPTIVDPRLLQDGESPPRVLVGLTGSDLTKLLGTLAQAAPQEQDLFDRLTKAYGLVQYAEMRSKFVTGG